MQILKPQTPRTYTGLSTENKPVLGINDTGAILYITDKKSKYEWHSNDWIALVLNGIPITKDLDFREDNVPLLEDISRKLSILIQYEALLHKIELEE